MKHTHHDDSDNQGSNANQVDLFSEEIFDFGVTVLRKKTLVWSATFQRMRGLERLKNKKEYMFCVCIELTGVPTCMIDSVLGHRLVVQEVAIEEITPLPQHCS